MFNIIAEPMRKIGVIKVEHKTINHIKIAKNFWLDEFQCKGEDCCGHLVKIESEVVEKVQKLRTEIGKPVIITSAYR